MKPRRLAFLDGLRGLAALWVVLFHAAAGHHIGELEAALPDWLHAKLSAGHFGVPMFFVLSGFVIAYAVRSHRVDAAYFGCFTLRRAIRLGLPYWASIAVAIAFLEMKGLATHTQVALPTPGELAAHAVYLQDVLGVHQINAVYWSLCYEMQFYLLFCLLVAAAQRSRFPVFAVAAAVSLAWPLVDPHVHGLCLPYWHGFLLGVFTCWALQGMLRPAAFALYAAALVALWLWSHDRFTLVCVATAAAIYAAGAVQKMDGWLRWRWVQFLGMVSYSLYLIHNPVMGAGFNVAYRVLPHSASGELAALLAVLAFALATAFAFWWLIERTSTALSRHTIFFPRNLFLTRPERGPIA
jgi:peptidoglycan/LPS O-acetylase OafA/YrhL